MTALATVRLVAMREINERLQGRLIRIVTLLTALLVVAAIVIPSLVRSSSKPVTIGLLGARAAQLEPALTRTASAVRVKIEVVSVSDAAAARAGVRSGSYDIVLSVGPRAALAVVKQSLSAQDRGLLQLAVQSAGLTAAPSVPVVTYALQPPPRDKAARSVAALAAALLMYLSLVMYGAAVANGVAQEKTSRAAEVLLAAVRPGRLLTGKIVGIGSLGLGQLAIAAIAGLIANAAVHSTSIPSSVWVLLPAFLVCFLLGFALYAFAFAAAGAIVARQEEVNFVTMPFAMLLLIGYLLAYAAIASPDATWLRVVSLLPPLSATLMPARIALGHISAWEVVLSLVLMLLAIWATAVVASRIYRVALMRGGARIAWRTALRL